MDIINFYINLYNNENLQSSKNNYCKNIGFYYHKLNNNKEALVWFLKINPKDSTVYKSIATIYIDLGLVNKGCEYIEQCLIGSFDIDLLYDMSLHYTKKCIFDKSISIYETIIELDPSYINAYNNIADIYCFTLNQKKAFECYKLGFELDNSRIDIYSNMIMTGYYILNYKLINNYKNSLKFNELIKTNIKLCNNNKIDKNKTIKIGYIGYDFNKIEHPISCFIKHILDNHDKNKFKIYCYQVSNKTSYCYQVKNDNLYTDSILNVTSVNLSGKSSLESAKIIYNDILIY